MTERDSKYQKIEQFLKDKHFIQKDEVLALKIGTIYDMKFACNPFKELLISTVRQWMKDRISTDWEDVGNVVPFTAWLFPESKDLEKLVILAKFITLLFPIDDEMETDKGIVSSYGFMMEDISDEAINQYNVPPLERAFREIYHELKSHLTVVQNNRLKNGLIDWFKSTKNKHKSLATKMTLKEYLDFRYKDLCTSPFLVFVEFIVGSEVKEDVYNHYLIQMYHKLSGDSMTLGNDITSYKKEYFREDVTLNGVTIVQKMHNCSIQKAFDIVVNEIIEMDNKMKAIKKKIIESGIDVPLDYLKGVADIMYGSIIFQLKSYRYTEFDIVHCF